MTKRPKIPIYYGGKLFRPVQTQGASETTSETIFIYQQDHDLVTATYSGGEIAFGQLIGVIARDGSLDLRYHHRNKSGTLMTGKCHTVPEILPSGKLRLHETWHWTSPDQGTGTSILEEF
ncbi:n-acetylglutamate synthase [Litorimonas haliclonae]|uniref:n-acetylglutamate synthase n=1 Tax=Litorimonas haliclonae TaxID=2081977 RepID=UPI0039EFC223